MVAPAGYGNWIPWPASNPRSWLVTSLSDHAGMPQTGPWKWSTRCSHSPMTCISSSRAGSMTACGMAGSFTGDHPGCSSVPCQLVPRYPRHGGPHPNAQGWQRVSVLRAGPDAGLGELRRPVPPLTPRLIPRSESAGSMVHVERNAQQSPLRRKRADWILKYAWLCICARRQRLIRR
jgi:hypothetical protein